MGILDQIESAVGGSANNGGEQQGQQAQVGGALMSAISEHPGGVGGLLDHFRQNGLGSHADSWVNTEPGQGTPQPLNQQQVEQGVPSGILNSISQRTGLPPQAVSGALATMLPLVMQHFTAGGRIPAPEETGGLAQGLMSKLF